MESRGVVDDDDGNANGLKPTSVGLADSCYQFWTTMVDQLSFDQKWDFRRKDDSDNSSSDDDLKSNSIHEPVLKKHKPALSPNNQTDQTSRLLAEPNPEIPSKESQIKSGKANKTGAGRRKKNDHEDVNERTGRSKTAALNNGTTSATEQEAPLEGLQTFMKSLIEDLNASRDRLFEQMTVDMSELEGDDASPKKETRRANNGRKRRVQPPKSEKRSKSTQVKGHDNEQNVQVHAQNRIKETVFVEDQSMLNQNAELQVSQNVVETQHTGEQDRLKCDTRAQNFNFGHLERFMRNSETGFQQTHFQAQQQVQDSPITEFDTPVHKGEGKNLVSSFIDKPSYQPSSSAQQNIPIKSVVLGIRAQSCNLGTAERSLKAKKSTEPKTINKQSENQTHRMVTSGSLALLTENYKNRYLEPLVEARFPSNLLVPGYSPSCSTFPSLLTEPARTIYGSASFPSNHVLLRKGTQELLSSDHQGHFPVNQPEKAIGSFRQSDMSNSNCFYQNNNHFSGFPVPFHQGINPGFYLNNQVSLENLQRDNTGIMGLRMNGGAIRFSGRSDSLSEQHSGTDITNLSEHRFNGRQNPYRVQNINNGLLFHK